MTRLLFTLLFVLFTSTISAAPRVLITMPYSTNVKQTFVISGSTFAGADLVHIWAWPSSGPVFVGQSSTVQPDAVTQFATGSFSVQAKNLPVGTYPIVVYVRDSATGTFNTQVVTMYTVSACTMVATCIPFFTGAGNVEFWFLEQCQ